MKSDGNVREVDIPFLLCAMCGHLPSGTEALHRSASVLLGVQTSRSIPNCVNKTRRFVGACPCSYTTISNRFEKALLLGQKFRTARQYISKKNRVGSDSEPTPTPQKRPCKPELYTLEPRTINFARISTAPSWTTPAASSRSTRAALAPISKTSSVAVVSGG